MDEPTDQQPRGAEALSRVKALLDRGDIAGAESLYRAVAAIAGPPPEQRRSEEHTSELQSLMRISYAVFCLKKEKRLGHEILYFLAFKWTRLLHSHSCSALLSSSRMTC